MFKHKFKMTQYIPHYYKKDNNQYDKPLCLEPRFST